MFPADCLPVPVYVYYDCRGGRGRRWFADGLKRLARSFFAAKLKPVKYPRVVRAELARCQRKGQSNINSRLPRGFFV